MLIFGNYGSFWCLNVSTQIPPLKKTKLWIDFNYSLYSLIILQSSKKSNQYFFQILARAIIVLFHKSFFSRFMTENKTLSFSSSGVNFINMLMCSFYMHRSQKHKKKVKSSVEKKITNLLCCGTSADLRFPMCAQVWWNWPLVSIACR